MNRWCWWWWGGNSDNGRLSRPPSMLQSTHPKSGIKRITTSTTTLTTITCENCNHKQHDLLLRVALTRASGFNSGIGAYFVGLAQLGHCLYSGIDRVPLKVLHQPTCKNRARSDNRCVIFIKFQSKNENPTRSRCGGTPLFFII